MFGRERHPSTERWQREARELLLSDQVAVLHALFCASCGLQDEARAALGVAGWDELDYLEAVESRRG